MLNKIELMGRMTRDPELRTTPAGVSVASFTIAVDRDFSGGEGKEKQTDFIDCVAWRKTGEFAAKYFKKGNLTVLTGSLQIRDWTDKDGNKRRSAEVIVDNMYFTETRRDGDSSATRTVRQEPARPAPQSVDSGEVSTDDYPF